jgi:hypothetical protein
MNLPVELRVHIYSYIFPTVPPVEAGTAYKGLLRSCKQSSTEVEPIVLQAMEVHLASIARASAEAWKDQITWARCAIYLRSRSSKSSHD